MGVPLPKLLLAPLQTVLGYLRGSYRDDLVADLNGMGGWVQCLPIGNGIYLEDNEALLLNS